MTIASYTRHLPSITLLLVGLLFAVVPSGCLEERALPNEPDGIADSGRGGGRGADVGGEAGVFRDEDYTADVCGASCSSAARECGPLPDVPGCDCGFCTVPQEICQDGQCVCLPDCTGKDCGPDGCGGTCGDLDGLCPLGHLCTMWGQCVGDCLPDCAGKECGDDGCGGSCGTCSGTGTTTCWDGICASVITFDGQEFATKEWSENGLLFVVDGGGIRQYSDVCNGDGAWYFWSGSGHFTANIPIVFLQVSMRYCCTLKEEEEECLCGYGDCEIVESVFKGLMEGEEVAAFTLIKPSASEACEAIPLEDAVGWPAADDLLVNSSIGCWDRDCWCDCTMLIDDIVYLVP